MKIESLLKYYSPEEIAQKYINYRDFCEQFEENLSNLLYTYYEEAAGTWNIPKGEAEKSLDLLKEYRVEFGGHN